jgi:hypothetical protein
MGKRKVVYRVLVGKTEGKRPLGRPRRRWDERKVYWDFEGKFGRTEGRWNI